MWYTYLLQSKKNKHWYTGCTSDLRKRFKRHQSSLVPATKGWGPFDLIYYESCLNKKDAFARAPLEIRRSNLLSLCLRQGKFLTGREQYLKSGMGKRYLRNRLKRFLSLTG